MIRAKLLATYLIALSTYWAHCQSTVNFSAGLGERDVRDITQKPLADGNYVKIGFFDTGFDIAAFNGDLLALAEAWNEYGRTTIQTIWTQPGRFSGTEFGTSPLFDNRQIWWWIFQTQDNSAPAANFENVLGFGLFSSSSLNWRFPFDGAPPPANMTSVNSTEVNQAYYGSFDSTHLFLQSVPEPSTVALISFGIGALAAWLMVRRRNPRL